MAKHHMFFTSAKAERELGYKAKPAEEGICEAIDWFRTSRIPFVTASLDIACLVLMRVDLSHILSRRIFA